MNLKWRMFRKWEREVVEQATEQKVALRPLATLANATTDDERSVTGEQLVSDPERLIPAIDAVFSRG